MSQDTYKNNPAIGYPGLESGVGDRFARSCINPTENIPFGRGVVKETTTEKGIKLPASNLDRFEGIVIAARGEQPGTSFPLNNDIPVLKRGSIIVEVEQEVSPNDNVYMRYTGKSKTQTINFDADLAAGNTIDLKIDGVSMTQVTFITDHLTTMTAIANQILSDFPSIASCIVGGVGNRVLTITYAIHGLEFLISDCVIAGGASQSSTSILETVAPISDNERGKFRKDNDNSTAVMIPNMKFTQNSIDGLVEIDINIV